MVPGDEGMDGAAHQIRQRHVRAAHLGVPHGAPGAQDGHRCGWGVRGGTAPRQPPPGDTRSVATGGMLAPGD